jgi:serine acetyltransferase
VPEGVQKRYLRSASLGGDRHDDDCSRRLDRARIAACPESQAAIKPAVPSVRESIAILRDASYHLTLRAINASLRFPGHRWRMFVVRRVSGWTVGEGSVIERGVTVSTRGRVTLGTNTNVNRDVFIDGRGTVVIGDQVNISPEVQVLTAEHDVRSADFAGRERGVIIGSRAWIASRAILLPGATIGEGAVIGAAAVVKGAVPAWTIWIGNPARQIGIRPDTAQTVLPTYRRWFH